MPTFSPEDLTALLLTLKLAALSTLLLLLICLPLAAWLARSPSRLRPLLETLCNLPLVLPPTVLGFYLLLLFSPNHRIGAFLTELHGAPLAFSFTGLLIGSVLYSLPFVIQPLLNTFRMIGTETSEAAKTLGATSRDRFFSITLPLARPGILSAAILGFAHTLGEFGVVLMIGGNLPGETKVLSIAIYEHVETLNYSQAHLLSATLLIFSFILLLSVHFLNRRLSLFHS